MMELIVPEGDIMAVIVKDMKMPNTCYECEFSERIDNGHTICKRKPMGPPVEDGNALPEFCPLEVYYNFNGAEIRLEEFLRNLETISDEELINEWNQAIENSKNSWMLEPEEFQSEGDIST